MEEVTDPRYCKLEMPCAVTVGTFDGLHLGHRFVLRSLRATADRNSWSTALLTFAPHPRAIVRPGSAPKLISSLKQRISLIRQCGFVDHIFVLPFDLSESRRSALSFVRDILVANLHMKALVVGGNFACGHARQGDGAFLRTISCNLGFEFLPLPVLPIPTGDPALPCSSSTVRNLIATGNFALARSLLGRPLEIDRAEVVGIAAPGVAQLDLPENACLPNPGRFQALYRSDGGGEWRPASLVLGRHRETRYAALAAPDLPVPASHFCIQLIGPEAGPRSAEPPGDGA